MVITDFRKLYNRGPLLTPYLHHRSKHMSNVCSLAVGHPNTTKHLNKDNHPKVDDVRPSAKICPRKACSFKMN